VLKNYEAKKYSEIERRELQHASNALRTDIN